MLPFIFVVQIDLNDRIVFVKHLFEGNQEDFNRVLSQLNTFKTEKEAKKFMDTVQTMKSKKMSESEGSFSKGGRAKLRGGGISQRGLGRAFMKGGKV